MRYWHLSQFAIIYVLEGKAMKKINCENCKYFGGQCQNIKPIGNAKTKRETIFPCKSSQEHELGIKSAIRKIYGEKFEGVNDKSNEEYIVTLGAVQTAEEKLLRIMQNNDGAINAFNEYKKAQEKHNSAAMYVYFSAGFQGGFFHAASVTEEE